MIFVRVLASRVLLCRFLQVEILGRSVRLHPDVGIFVTMNPGYAGRYLLPTVHVCTKGGHIVILEMVLSGHGAMYANAEVAIWCCENSGGY